MQDEVTEDRSSRRWQELRDQARSTRLKRGGAVGGVVSDTKLQTDLTASTSRGGIGGFQIVPGRGSNSEQINILERQAGANLRGLTKKIKTGQQ